MFHGVTMSAEDGPASRQLYPSTSYFPSFETPQELFAKPKRLKNHFNVPKGTP